MYDGYCASTCTIFSEFMRQQGDIKTIALGGRPTEGIIQAVGGTKGTNNYDWDTIFYFVNDTLALANETYREYLEGTELVSSKRCGVSRVCSSADATTGPIQRVSS